jgi:hypothetical protein
LAGAEGGLDAETDGSAEYSETGEDFGEGRVQREGGEDAGGYGG